MARFTLFFKEHAIQSKAYENGVIRIGRDHRNDIAIDSLAVAPVHAMAIIRDGNCQLKQLNADFPLRVNEQTCSEYFLQNNDRISIGKHAILYTTEARKSAVSANDSSVVGDYTESREANLQVMDGKHIGRIIPIKKAITRLGRSGEGVIIISKRKEGYFISALESHSNLTINKKLLADHIVKLAPHDLIHIDNISMQFFLD